ncbi:MAG: glycoside hydrolase family 5 protein [Bacteroidales bacterium]|nr:glycoside hydrolase family 5 protein [Bacteroidales bacterium]
MKKISTALLLVLFCACGPKEDPADRSVCNVALQPLRRVDATGTSAGELSVKWVTGDIVLLSSDASDSGETVSVSPEMISGNSIAVNVSSFSGNLYFVKVPDVNPVYDGSLKSAYYAAGGCRKGEESALLTPRLGVLELSVSKSGVYAIRISADSDIFPSKVSYDFKTGGISVKAAGSSVTIDALSPVRIFVPIVPEGQLSGCIFEFLNENGQTMASFNCEASLTVPSGTALNLGQVDAGVDFPSQGTDLTVGMEDAAAIMPKMGIGLNLCGTFDDVLPYQGVSGDRSDPISFETLHKQGVTTQATMDATYEAGFRCMRIPITWYAHMDNTLASIDKVFLDRIEEVVNYALNAGLYCIINVHHDNGDNVNTWMWADMDLYPDISPRFKNIWGQIARRFRDYDDRLLFESYNELLDTRKSWGYPKVSSAFEAANRLNQDFVNTVRSTGGKNYARNLIVTTYAASASLNTLQQFTMPSDKLPGRLIAQVHSYVPYNFCRADKDVQVEFPDSDIPAVEDVFTQIKQGLQDRGIPCILGEYGAFPVSTRTQTQLGRHAAVYTRNALKNGVVPVYWYNPMAYQNRTTGQWSLPELKDSLITAYKEFLNN